MGLKLFQWVAQPFILVFYSWAFATVAFVERFYITVPLLLGLNLWATLRIKKSWNREYWRLVHFNAIVYVHFPLIWILWMTGYRTLEGRLEFGLFAYAVAFTALAGWIWWKALRKKKP